MAFPNITACFLCEGARPELGGKFNVLGYYGVVPHIRVQIQDFNKPINLCFVFAGGPGHGHFRIGLRITGPNGTTFNAPGLEGDLIPQAAATNVFLSFQGVLPGPGNYLATLFVNDAQQFQAPFGLEPMGHAPA